jgi:hypothetical protein
MSMYFVDFSGMSRSEVVAWIHAAERAGMPNTFRGAEEYHYAMIGAKERLKRLDLMAEKAEWIVERYVLLAQDEGNCGETAEAYWGRVEEIMKKDLGTFTCPSVLKAYKIIEERKAGG